MKTRTIGIFTGYYIPHLGGVERYVQKLSTALERLGYRIVIVTFNHGQLASYEETGSRHIYRLPIHNLAKERYPLPKVDKSYKKLKHQIEKEEIDFYIVNTRFHLTSIVGVRMGKTARKPVILIEHGTNHFTVGNKALDFVGKIYEHLLSNYLKVRIDKFYGVSQKCNEWLKHFSIKASGVFYNSVEITDEKSVSNHYAKVYAKGEIVITYASRLIKEKGILNLLDAFEELSLPKGTKVRLVIAGSGDLYDKIKNENSQPNVDIVGKLDFEHILALFKRTDIFVHPSLYPEGLPTSILEAGLMSCAIIATPKGGTEEVIPDGDHGIIVDGTTESLVTALQSLITHTAKRKSMAKQVHIRVKKLFNWDSVAAEVDRELSTLKAE